MSEETSIKSEIIYSEPTNENDEETNKLLDCNNIVFILPELDMDSEEPLILSEITDPDGVHAIFIEVPQMTAEETIESYSSSTGLESNNATIETDPLCTNDEFYLSGSNDYTTLQPAVKRCADTQDSPPREPHPRTERRSYNKPSRPKSKEEAPDCGKSNDLLWLLNFKLDGFIKNNALDEIPPPNQMSSDAKVDAAPPNQQRTRHPSEMRGDSGSRKAKPPFTYTELIECALHEKGPMTVSEIYQWISDTFPYFNAWDDRWKNSVRHNLSINPYFRKGSKAKQGSGHLWTVSKSAESARGWNLKRQKYQEFEAYTRRMKVEEKTETRREEKEVDLVMDDAREAEIAAACIENKENQVHHLGKLPSHPQSSAMEQSAGEILSGVKRTVAVEFIEPKQVNSSITSDFLNPVSKEDLMGECGFLNQIEVNLTAESTDHMEIVESEQVFEHLEDLGFQFTDVISQCPQLLPLVN